jgi:adenine-specific DNA-methyltransferase
MARGKGSKPPIRVEAVKHRVKRANIPTQELREFVAEDEAKPKNVAFEGLLYARDPSLDPQLVWKGKDEQDRSPLEVPAVPVYIQEKIQPRAIIENLRAEARKERKEAPGQIEMFSDFNGIEWSDLVDFYHHEQNWSNRLILGDSLLVMTSLAEKENLKGKVQMIYLDPPYGIKFGSNWQVSTRKRDVKDGKAEDVTRQPEQIRAFRDTWQLGIHSYLTYLRDRMVVARELLTDSGSIFVQIGDENVHLVRSLLDEVFGAENFVAQLTFAKTGGSTRQFLPGTCDFLLFYAKSRERLKFRAIYADKTVESEIGGPYAFVELPDGTRRRMTSEERTNPSLLPRPCRVYRLDNLQSQSIGREKGEGASCWFPVSLGGKEWLPNSRSRWKTNEEGMKALGTANRLEATSGGLYYVRFIGDFAASPIGDQWTDTVIAGFASQKAYVVETSTKVIERCILMTTDPGDLVLDPTCGSGTTAYVAEQWGRRWITIDTSRVALALARTRVMAARFPYYLLADSPDGQRKEAEAAGHVRPEGKTENDIRKGFVYRRVSHVTLKSIANNEEIDAIHERLQPKLDALLARLNAAIKKKLRQWEVPREPLDGWPATAKKSLQDWWGLRQVRQTEIDASIAKHADTELLVDQPYEDAKRIRVSGPFTVESLSPHRVLATDEERPTSEREARAESTTGQFELMILDNIKKAGVQNTRREERLKFDRLDTHAGLWLHATGEYTDAAGESRRVAISIGPEHGTVGAEQVKEAAKEALKGPGFDLLLVCGFAFDAHAGETTKEFAPSDGPVVSEAKQWGKLRILLVHMNPDLAMGDELLKKTGAGNLFMVFGEPDVRITRNNGKLLVELKGVDVYDPTTGVIRSSSPDDIACWFLDTNYNGESFFVRHAYFTGAEEPYDKLKRSLRAEIDEAAWSALYATRSMPFDPPTTGKIAIKVINHYGDEVLKVFEVDRTARSRKA